MSNAMDFLPFDMTTTQRKSGFDPYPAGFYLLEIQDGSKVDTYNKKDGSGTVEVRSYTSNIVMGPGWSQEHAGKTFRDRIGQSEEDAGRHMDLFCAALGSEEAVRQTAAQNQGRVSPAMLVGRRYIAHVTVSKDGRYNNVARRIAHTDENWKSNVPEPESNGMMAAPAAAPSMMQPQAAPPAPAQAPAMAPPPVQQQYAQPPQQQQYAPPAPAQPGVPSFPQAAPPAQAGYVQQPGAPMAPAAPPPAAAPVAAPPAMVPGAPATGYPPQQ